MKEQPLCANIVEPGRVVSEGGTAGGSNDINALNDFNADDGVV